MHRIMTILAIAACAAGTASATGMSRDLRPQHATDTRVALTLENQSSWFRDVSIGGHKYTLMPGDVLAVHAPAGTVVYAASAFGHYHHGDMFLEVAPEMNHKRIAVN